MASGYGAIRRAVVDGHPQAGGSRLHAHGAPPRRDVRDALPRFHPVFRLDVLVQDATAAHPGMPRAAAEHAHRSLPLDRMGRELGRRAAWLAAAGAS
jgi:hypothetical protein